MNQHNNQDTIGKLFSSLADLEAAIGSAKVTLARKTDVPEEVLERLNSYTSILTKQRNLAQVMCSHIKAGNLNEVSRHVSLINGLSKMIRDDARGILASITNPEKEPCHSDDTEKPLVC